MTRLVEVMQDMGLKGETSSSGRWIRLSGKQGPIYVVEAAWHGGYYTFSDAEAEQKPEIYLDPAAAIEAGLQHVAGNSMVAQKGCGLDRTVYK